MTEVEKLYELAGVEKEFDYLECHRGTSSICCPLMDYESERDEECEGCVNSSKMQKVYSYPPFTAEKQIELIKWLARRTHITIGLGLSWGQSDDDWWTITGKKGGVGTDKYRLEEALVKLVINLWQDLTKEEQEQIREILK